MRRRARERIKLGIAQRQGLPGAVPVDEHRLAVTLRVERSEAEIEADRQERLELEEVVPELHGSWNLTALDLATSRRPIVGGLLTRVRLWILRMLRPMLEQQSAYNGANARLASVLRNRSIRQQEIVETVAGQALDVISKALRRHTEALLELDRAVRRLEQNVERLSPLPAQIDELAFLERFQGSEADVKQRLRGQVTRFDPGREVVDLACGRGEFVELLREDGIESRGVDDSGSLVDHARAKGLPVERRDALSFLEETPAGSLGGIFASGLVERLDPDEVVGLLGLARSALGDGGVLVLEVGRTARDLVGVQPYRADVLGWLLEREGFEEVRIDAEPSTPAFTVAGRRA